MSNGETRWYVCTYCHQPLSKCGGNHKGYTYSCEYRCSLHVDALSADLEAAQARIAALETERENTMSALSDAGCIMFADPVGGIKQLDAARKIAGDIDRTRIAALTAVVEQVEWVLGTEPSDRYCPWCGKEEWEGHAPDCPRQAALGLKAEE